MSDLPTVQTGQDIEKHAGRSALVRGTYVEVDVRKAQTPPPVHAGHVAVRLDDGTLVMLGSLGGPNDTRTEKERKELADKEVIAQGILFQTCPPMTPGASLQIPCLSPVLSVLTPEMHEMLHEGL